MRSNKIAEEFIIYQMRGSRGLYHRIPICGLCNNSGMVRLHADCEGRVAQRPCICPNGRVLLRAQKRGKMETEPQTRTSTYPPPIDVSIDPPVQETHEPYEPAHYRTDWDD